MGQFPIEFSLWGNHVVLEDVKMSGGRNIYTKSVVILDFSFHIKRAKRNSGFKTNVTHLFRVQSAPFLSSFLFVYRSKDGMKRAFRLTQEELSRLDIKPKLSKSVGHLACLFAAYFDKMFRSRSKRVHFKNLRKVVKNV